MTVPKSISLPLTKDQQNILVTVMADESYQAAVNYLRTEFPGATGGQLMKTADDHRELAAALVQSRKRESVAKLRRRTEATPERKTIHLMWCVFRRVEGGPLEEGVLINEGDLIIDMDGKPVPAPIHHYEQRPYRFCATLES